MLSVTVIPWEDTLKWTETGMTWACCSRLKALSIVRRTASGPVNDSVSHVNRYVTLQAKIGMRLWYGVKKLEGECCM